MFTGAMALSSLLPNPALACPRRQSLNVDSRVLEVHGKPAKVFSLLNQGGTPGLTLDPGQPFSVRVYNRSAASTVIHWHGQTPPNDQDGVPDLTQPPIKPGASYDYDFMPRPGTHWMHSHVGLQEQRLLAAHSTMDMDMNMNMEGMAGMENMAGMEGMSGMVHLNDVEYDAYLANDRTLDDPEVIRVELGGRVRVRLINAASATNFTVDLGELQGRAVAVDGNAIAPLAARRFPLAIAQRLDIEIDLPAGNGAWPVTAIREGAAARTGIVLATRNATIAKLAAEADEQTGPIDPMFEQRLRPATRSPAQTADRANMSR
ncbi:multicopper oxidase domain-containing protein [Candidatus Spongiihabitans sp.]|uniref:multicopper oxidase domain-containing protein n=1 Tax=Candidatus Spongiihabitans sp. TaxID=3101308 RepID=UPI003C7A3AA5